MAFLSGDGVLLVVAEVLPGDGLDEADADEKREGER
jgi:hypothetical protein